MYLKNQWSINSCDIENKLDQVIGLYKKINVGVDMWQKLLGVTESDFSKITLGKMDLKFKNLMYLADNLKVDLDQLINCKVDIKAVEKHLAGNLDYIPEKYTVGTGTYIRSILNHLNYIERVHGKQYRSELLMRLQLTEYAIQNSTRKVNIRLIKDIIKYTDLIGFKDKSYVNLGQYTAITYQGTEVANSLQGSKSPEDIYLKMVDGQEAYEENFNYKMIKMNKSSCLIEGTPKEEKMELLKTKSLTNRKIDLIKEGIFSAAPQFANLSHSTVATQYSKKKNIPICQFHINFQSCQKIKQPSGASHFFV